MIVFFSVEKSFNIIMYFFLKLKIFKTNKTATFYTQSINQFHYIESQNSNSKQRFYQTRTVKCFKLYLELIK